MNHHTKHLSFLFVIDLTFLKQWKQSQLPEINVRYTLNWKGEVILDDYNVKPGMAQHIEKWNELEEQMLEAARNNAESYRRPGDWMSNSVPSEVDPHYEY